MQHLLIAGALAVLAFPSVAQNCPVAFDVNTTLLGGSSNPSTGTEQFKPQFAQVAGIYYLAAASAGTNTELYRTDGTTAGTSLVKDIRPGELGSNPTGMISAGGRLFFAADDGVNGAEPWVSDGTTAGTVMLRDINIGTESSAPTEFVAMGGGVFFAANNGTKGSELWFSDGTSLGTRPIKDINPGPAGSAPHNGVLNSAGTHMLFTARQGGNGDGLFVTDGTFAGTQLLKAPEQGGIDGVLGMPFAWNGQTFFTGFDAAHGYELWVTDGTPGGTVLFLDHRPGPASSFCSLGNAAVFNGQPYFGVTNSLGNILMKTDGTPAGTTAITIGGQPFPADPKELTVVGNELFFTGYLEDPGFRKLLKLDMADVVTVVADKAGGTFGFNQKLTEDFNGLTSIGGNLAFVLGSSKSSNELWMSDGTSAGTHLVTKLAPGAWTSQPRMLTPLGSSEVLFSAETLTLGRELWKSDLSPPGTQLVKNINTTSITRNANPGAALSPDGQHILFAAELGYSQRGLWRAKLGTSPTLLGNLAKTSFAFYSWPQATTWDGVQQTIYFAGHDAAHGVELWSTDGTPGGTAMVADLNPGSGSSFPKSIRAFGDKIVFTAFFTDAKRQPAVSDGTAAGTWLLQDIEAGSPIDEILSVKVNQTIFHPVGDRLIFGGRDTVNGSEIWSTDGTVAGTQILFDIGPGNKSSSPRHLTRLGDLLYFIINDQQGGSDLWSTDGTTAGTHFVVDLDVTSKPSSAHDLFAFGGQLVMSIDTNTVGRELYISDGTTAAVNLLANLSPGSSDGDPEDFTVSDGVLYFTANYQGTNRELWKSDGTTLGTSKVTEIDPLLVGSDPSGLIATDGGLYFAADDGVNGRELWFSDGTAAGTIMVCDLAPGPDSSSPKDLVFADGVLYFSAFREDIGREIFHLPTPGPYAFDLGFGVGTAKLKSTPPQLGSIVTIACNGITQGDLSLLVISAPVGAPSNFLVSAGQASWLDPTTAFLVNWFTGTSWTYNAAIPNDPGLVGFHFNMQAYQLPAATFPATSSNGLSMVLGN